MVHITSTPSTMSTTHGTPRIGTSTPRLALQIMPITTPRDRDAEDLERGDAGGRRDETAATPAGVAQPRVAARSPTTTSAITIQLAVDGEVAVGEVVDDVVLDRQRAAVAEDDQHDALEPEQPGERHDERRQADAGDERALERADQRGDHQRGRDRGPPRPATVLLGQQLGHDHARHAAHEPGRQVDLAEEEHPHLGHGQQHEHRALHQQVDEVAGAQELRVERLEDDRDQEQAEEHREQRRCRRSAGGRPRRGSTRAATGRRARPGRSRPRARPRPVVVVLLGVQLVELRALEGGHADSLPIVLGAGAVGCSADDPGRSGPR